MPVGKCRECGPWSGPQGDLSMEGVRSFSISVSLTRKATHQLLAPALQLILYGPHEGLFTR